MNKSTLRRYPVVDLFCGVGGLTHGFYLEGFEVIAGIDSDPSCKYAFEKNNNSRFIEASVKDLAGIDIEKLFPRDDVKILVGCAPCQPFSTYTNKQKNKSKKKWSLLKEFGRLIEEVQPEIVSMENVPSLGSKEVFTDFVELLDNDYQVNWSNVFCPDYGVPQQRNRLVLLASKLGNIHIIEPTHAPDEYVTVRDKIEILPPIAAGETHPDDPLHRAGKMSEMNLKRIKSSKPGGTWQDWDEELRAPCHRRSSGSSYYNVYGRMKWDEISPVITTQFTGFGNGRFGHPTQDRAISLREGALLQTFPDEYEFFAPGSKYYFTYIVRHIGNAVPVELGRAIARSIRQHLEEYGR
jgi:DNA (cytosine-5)-methyltransferase 1